VKPIITIFLLSLFLNIKGQLFSPYYNEINTNNGLPSNTIYAIVQDKNGVIYIAHEEGLSRYNGRTFKHYKNPGKGKSLSFPVFTEEGDLLATSFYGDIVRISNNHIALESPILKNKSNRISFRKFGKRIILHTQNQLFEYENNAYKEIKVLENNKDELWILDIFIDKQNVLHVLCGINNITAVINISSNISINKITYYPFQINNKSNLIQINNCLYVYQIEENRFYDVNNQAIYTEAPKLKYDNKTVKWLRMLTIDNNYFCITGYDGLLIFNSNGETIAHLLKGVQVSGAMKDKEGNLWVTTLNEGIYIFPDLNILEFNLENIIGKHDFIKSSCFMNAENILTGTNKGKLLKINSKEQTIKTFEHELKGDVQTIYYDSLNSLIYTFCDGIYVINEKNFKLINRINITSTKDIYFDNNSLYCATSANLIKISNGTQKAYFEGKWINCILPDKKDSTLILGSNKGLLKLNLKTEKEENIKVNIEGFDNAMVTNLQMDDSGNLYFIASNIGIIKTSDFINFHVLIQNPNIRKFKITRDKLYISFNNELLVYNIKPFQLIHQLNETKSMNSNILDFNANQKSITVIHPKKVKLFKKIPEINSQPPQILLNGISGSYNKNKADEYVSQYKNDLEFELEVLPNIKTANKFTLYYRVKEIDGDWVKFKNETGELKFRYQQINSGNYHFEAYAINEDNISSEIFKINFKVESPFWKKWWFITLISLISGTVLIYIYSRRIKGLQKLSLEKIESQNTKIKLLSAELTAIRSQMNPHFIFNTLSSIQAKVITAKGEEAADDIARFSQLIRSVLNYSSKEYIILAKEIEFIKNYLYLESSRFEGKIQYEINTSSELDIHFLEIPTLITIPFIENALIHGLLHKEGEKKLNIWFSERDEVLEIRISDNGIGRKKSSAIQAKSGKKHQSFAMQATAKRIERINETGNMRIELNINDLEEGTEIILTIKYLN
jgi:ligand-binding sensor domain-containing protein